MAENLISKSFSDNELGRKASFTLQNPFNVCPHLALSQFSSHSFLPKFLCKYKLGQVLGYGACSIVCLATSGELSEPSAVKFILKDRIPISKWTRDRKLGSVPLEVSILSRIKHPNIIAFKEYFEDEKSIYLVTEAFSDAFAKDLPVLESPNAIKIPTRTRASSSSLVNDRQCSAIDLWEASSTDHFQVFQVKEIARQLADALSYLHTLQICHGENILIDSQNNIKVIDFGGAVVFDDRLSISTKHFLGTLAYSPPLQADFYNPVAAEMWCVGLLLNMLLYGSRQISTGKGLANELINGLMHGRINPVQFKNHEWLKE